MGLETLEAHELIEEEPFKHGDRDRRFTTRVALTAAILAMLTSISALQAERTVAASILQKNDAVLWQSRASDEWAYRQAKSIKLHLQELVPGSATAAAPREEITASEERARVAEKHRDEANTQAAEWFESHHRFAASTSLLQIAIVLATVAAVVERRSILYGAIALGAVGVVAVANGFLGFV